MGGGGYLSGRQQGVYPIFTKAYGTIKGHFTADVRLGSHSRACGAIIENCMPARTGGGSQFSTYVSRVYCDFLLPRPDF